MNLRGRQVESFLESPDETVRAVLFYGPESGLVIERAETLARTVVDDLSDPFRVVELGPADIKDDPARLRDEAAAIAMTGGRRVVRVREAGDNCAGAVENFLSDPAGDALVVVEARELPPRSKLRKLFETSKTAAAAGCYVDDAGTLEDVVVEMLRNEGFTIDPDALAFLVGHLGSNRQVTRREIEKLVLYKGPCTEENSRVTLGDVEASVGDSFFLTQEDIVYAAGAGDLAALDRALQRALAEGVNPVSILRAVAGHLQRLHFVCALVARGAPVDAAMKELRPGVHFKRQTSFRVQAGLWSEDRIATAMSLVIEAELGCKTTGMPAEAVCGRALYRIATAARRGRR